ncbi:hypothetical protein GCM10020001_036580 [Nonomuraea salmonea]
MEVCQGDAAGAVEAAYLDDGVQRGERHGHVGRVRGDAVVAHAEDRRAAVEPVERVAAGAALALVAGGVSVVEVRAAGALEQVAADGGHVAQLRRGPGEQRLRQHRVAGADPPVGGQHAVADERADTQAAVGELLDGVERQARDVHDGVGPLDALAHEVDEVGAAADETGSRLGRGGQHGGLDVGGLDVRERPHRPASPTTSMIASTMPL